ncbi:stress response translation initiation inhibitor YciH [Teredinibacter waterburyi]|jgi:translation initiation factor 1 (eIF-1/SUI1)|uniref:stress response translation initiation inhibitor YciH n=1 Tax=Teredinibacter waterburyi TaxID=1500538 RepID=UPI00165F1EF0|nr:stress response translation initiation inhibitor YciH [Teredinibacter waterburyi]
MKDNNRLVYSTDKGRIKETTAPQKPEGDGILRIRRETKGRNGKGVTVIDGFLLDEQALKAEAKKLKQLCGTGGTAKGGSVEIQGDHRQKLADYLKTEGFQVKLSGG